ncbi:dUTP diphosphatase [Corynebacterium sp.]|uniref:dUTP diphosphatase n=1 Tax=Corynebacterium sp. TaxID=1720 RepID=UPI0028B16E9E|nr:dUTP diphosphatase [Corynebacterium sp.]
MRITITLDPGALPPRQATPGAAAHDLHALTDATILPGRVAKIHTGVHLGLPDHHHAYILSRSGLASGGVWVANAPGLIDPDYRGEICVLLYNSTNYKYQIAAGDRVAQLQLPRCLHPEFAVVDELDETVRGSRGFGSTGTGQAVTVR